MTSSYSLEQRSLVFDYLERFMTLALGKRRMDANRGNLIGVDGPIGVGKSRLCENLARHFGQQGREAFVAKETVLKGWLAKFYDDKKKWAGEFQNNQLNLCTNAINVAQARCDTKDAIAIVDRTPIGNACFFFANIENIDADHRELYEESFVRCGPYLHTRVVYLNASVDTIYDRIQERIRSDPCRASEKGITKDYLRSLDEMMILVALFLHYRGVVPVTFVHWEDCTAAPGPVADMIRDCGSNGARDKHWETTTKGWLLKADYRSLKARVRTLSLVPGGGSD